MDDYTIHNILKSGSGAIQCEAAEKGVIPKHPMRLYVVGASKSGKTNLVVSLLSEDRFYKGYWPKKNIFITDTLLQKKKCMKHTQKKIYLMIF